MIVSSSFLWGWWARTLLLSFFATDPAWCFRCNFSSTKNDEHNTIFCCMKKYLYRKRYSHHALLRTLWIFHAKTCSFLFFFVAFKYPLFDSFQAGLGWKYTIYIKKSNFRIKVHRNLTWISRFIEWCILNFFLNIYRKNVNSICENLMVFIINHTLWYSSYMTL